MKTFLTTLSFLLQAILVYSAPQFKLEENQQNWEPKTEEQVYDIYESCARSTNTNDKVLGLFKAHILSNDSANLMWCIDSELRLLEGKTFYADRASKQFALIMRNSTISEEKLEKCFHQANHLESQSDFLVYFRECLISYSLWKRPSGEQARENKQSCQTIHNITQYDICHGSDPMKIAKYSICDNLKSGVYQGNESIGFGYNFHRMALLTFAYLPPYEVFLDIGKCMKQGRAYKSEELFTVMNCINDIIPPKWRPKTRDEITKSLGKCRRTTNISDELYDLLKLKTVRLDSMEFLRCVSWQLGMESGGCYISQRTVTQIKLLNPTINETEIQQMVEKCYSEHLTTKENWNEFEYHQCILSMKEIADGKGQYLEILM
ncbi:Obp99c.2 family protein [Megaselia abdita]